jgi:hypothetical protein
VSVDLEQRRAKLANIVVQLQTLDIPNNGILQLRNLRDMKAREVHRSTSSLLTVCWDPEMIRAVHMADWYSLEGLNGMLEISMDHSMVWSL